LNHLLAQFGVYHNVALNAVAIGLQFSSERLKLTEDTVNFAHRSHRYLAQQIAEMLARHFGMVTGGLPLRLKRPVQGVLPLPGGQMKPDHRPSRPDEVNLSESEIS
jgi:hypothetical protein